MGISLTRGEMLVGARLGQHEVVRLVGHGATASVFEARHVALGKSVALKILHEHLAADANVSARFVREGRVAAQIRHPNVLDVLDVGVERGVPYLVMELLDGVDLRTHLAEAGPISVHDALAILFPVASALAYAHDLGAIHRDLKPANIFLARDARGDIVPKLVDFGLSKIVGGDDGPPLTSTDIVVGTLQYMAPEQTKGSRFAGTKSDLYALAVVLYELVTRRHPFEASGFYDLLEAIRVGVVKPPTVIDARIPEAFEAALLRGMHRDPEKRFSSVRAFARELLPFADEATASAWSRDFGDDDAPSPAGSRPRIPKPTAVSAPAKTSSPPMRPTPESTSRISKVDALPCAPGKSPFHIKGNPYRGLVHMVESGVPGGMDALCEALDDERLRAFVRQPFLATGRYDVLPIVPIMEAVARILDQPFDALIRVAASAQAKYDARTVYKRIYEDATVESLVERIPRFGAQYYDFGKFGGRIEGPRKLVLEHAGIPKYLYRWYRPMHEAYTEESGRLCGAKDAQATALSPISAGTRGSYELVTASSEMTWR